MESTCPRCGSPLGENQEATNVVMGMNVKGCPGCGGFLIDYGEAENVLGKAMGHLEEHAIQPEALHPEARTPLSGSCPYCGGEFAPSPIKFELSNNMAHLDQCVNCQGIWFDKGELSQIFEFAMKEAIAAGSLNEDTEGTFSQESGLMGCPRCNKETEFGKSEILGIEITKCKICNGIWLDAGEVEALVGEVRPASGKEEESLVDKAAAGKCPKCNVSLQRWGNMPESLKDLYIDFCPHCMGLWFDKGEFKSLFRIFSESPFLNV